MTLAVSDQPNVAVTALGDAAASPDASHREPSIAELLRGSGRGFDIYDDAWPATFPVFSALDFPR